MTVICYDNRQKKKAQSERSNRVPEGGKKSQKDWSTSLKQGEGILRGYMFCMWYRNGTCMITLFSTAPFISCSITNDKRFSMQGLHVCVNRMYKLLKLGMLLFYAGVCCRTG